MIYMHVERHKWRLIVTPPLGAAMNMAIDEALMESCQQGGAPTLRFYTWQPSAVSLGHFQSLEKDVNVEGCQEYSLDIVRRLTGGKAVIHDEDFTYSVIVREDHPLVPPKVVDAYRVLCQGLLMGLNNMGIMAECALEPRQHNKNCQHDDQETDAVTNIRVTAACFEKPSAYEIVVAGRKLLGSAQVRQKGVLLQHGALLLKFDPLLHARVLKLGSRCCGEAGARKAAELLAARVSSVQQCLGRIVPFDEIAAAMSHGFSQGLGIEVAVSELSSPEQARAQELAETKYSTDEWNRDKIEKKPLAGSRC